MAAAEGAVERQAAQAEAEIEHLGSLEECDAQLAATLKLSAWESSAGFTNPCGARD